MTRLMSTAAALCVLAACANAGLMRGAPHALAPFGLGEVRPRAASSEIDGQIVGGHDALPGEFPHQVSMQVVMPGFLWFDADGQHICGGTLIAEDWVLTAAHCVKGVPTDARKVLAVVGITDLTQAPAGSQKIEVVRMFAHNSYDPLSNGGVGPWDIALLKLATKAKLSDTVKLAYLPAKGAIPTGDAVLSGWGSTSTNGNRPVYPDKLKTATFPVMPFKKCYDFISGKSPSYNPLQESSNLCVGDLNKAGLSSCSGDSGGPLIQKEGKEAVVIGVVSWGLANCGKVPYPSVYTRVSGFNDWIAGVQKQYSS